MNVGSWLTTIAATVSAAPITAPAAEVLALGTAAVCFLWWSKNEHRKIHEETLTETAG